MKIHFVWMGQNQGSRCTATPVAVAQMCPKHQVWLWVLKANAQSLLEATSKTGVQIMLLDSDVGPLGAQTWVKDSFRVINTLAHFNAWAAAKDLAVLLIMYNYGGLYLDTTCVIASEAESNAYVSKLLHAGVKARSLSTALEALGQGGGPALPLIPNEVVGYQPGVRNIPAILNGLDPKLENQFPIVDMPQVDVWSYFSPEKHQLFFNAALSYVIRAKTIGLDDVNSAISAGREELAGGHRNDLFGQLIIQSVYDSFAGLGITSQAVLAMGWQTCSFKSRPANVVDGGNGEVKADIVPELGIIKQYRGTWRTNV